MTTNNFDSMDLVLESLNVRVNIDPSQGITTAEHHKYYPELGIPWKEGLNIVNGDTTIQRVFSELEFPSNVPIWVEEVDLGREDEVASGRYFYKLTTNFHEVSYSSTSGFYKWEYRKQVYLLEKWFFNTLDREIVWQPTTPIRIFPHTIRFNPGKALGIEVVCSEPIFIHSSTQASSKQKLSPFTPPELSITLPERVPNSLVVRLYGLRESPSMRRFHPLNELIEDRATLIHPIGTDYTDRLIPPNKDFKRNFWNDPLKEEGEEVMVERLILNPNLSPGFI